MDYLQQLNTLLHDWPAVIAGLVLCQGLFLGWFLARQSPNIEQQLKAIEIALQSNASQLLLQLVEKIKDNERQLAEQLGNGLLRTQNQLTENLHLGIKDIRAQLELSFKQHAEGLTGHVGALTHDTKAQLAQLTQLVQQQLQQGFEKNATTFQDVIKRLTVIDEAQRKITELSNSVVGLQDILNDKKSRGAFGEVQLENLIRNMIPAQHVAFQHTFSNGKRVDCLLQLPEPSGNIAIDAKFPLEAYQKLQILAPNDAQYKSAVSLFRQDIQKHIKDVAEKYILPPETGDGAVLFIPSESIFAEIHANHMDVVESAHRQKVWLVSPTTLMAVLTTAKAVLKDDATRKQIHIIQEHLHALAQDFDRFEKRMDKLTRHIDQAQQDVGDIATSAKKITRRFQRIESVQLDEQPDSSHATLLELEEAITDPA